MGMRRTRPVASTKQMIPAMRHQGYHTPYALAELVDNSIQAGAKHVEILCMDEKSTDTNKRQIQKIAVLDDGDGMSENELWDSLRLGESQNRGKGGIGRFGVGLIHASLSQCRRVDIYSWKRPGVVLQVHLDLDSVVDSDSVAVEEPIKARIQSSWKKISRHMSRSGTLVVWSTLDLCRWKKAKTVIDKSELMIGRTYRKFLDRKKLEIRMVSFDSTTNKPEIDRKILPNDPLYLMAQSSTPAPWSKTAMFQKDGSRWEVKTPIRGTDGKMHNVITRYSFAKKEVRKDKRNPGSTDYGKHAADNLGVSVVRANRELNLDTNLLISYDPVERWWGAEIEFPPALDDIFGVSSNKQSAPELIYMMRQFGKQSREERGKNDIDDEEDNPLVGLVRDMTNRLRALRGTLDKQRTTKTSKDVSGGIKEPSTTKPTVTSKQKSSMTEKERGEAIKQLVKQLGIDDEQWTLDSELRFEHAPMSGNQFFDVALVGGIKVITINSDHKAYKNLLAMLLKDEKIADKQAVALLKKSADGFRKFLASWARLEDLRTNPAERNKLADIRYEWGTELQKYFEVNEY